jgi:flagellar biosynthesis regulator FlbT
LVSALRQKGTQKVRAEFGRAEEELLAIPKEEELLAMYKALYENKLESELLLSIRGAIPKEEELLAMYKALYENKLESELLLSIRGARVIPY